MQRKSYLKLVIAVAVMCIILVFTCSCYSNAEKDYYLDKNNYITVTGEVTSIKYNEGSTALYLEFTDLSPVLDDTCLKIVGKNLQIVQNNGIDNKLKLGAKVKFITAPKYFGDGYVMPIVAISINGEFLLKFEEGYENLLEWL